MSPNAVCSSLRALMEGLIDYAGLFPPARLPLDEAVAAYAAARQGPHRWMLGRFICPVGRLAEFGELARGYRDEGPWPVAVLGLTVDTAAAWPGQVARDLAAVNDFNSVSVDIAEADVFEVALPALEPVAVDVTAALTDSRARVFLEVPLREGAEVLMAALQVIAKAPPVAGVAVGAKFRTGGVTAELFPSCAAVACAIEGVLAHAIPFKATAGLHHPLRHHNAGVATHMHGFINVFGGAGLRHSAALPAAALEDLLACEAARAFQFDDTGLAWESSRMTTAQIRAARSAVAVSYGSCSFSEPIEDLQQLGLL